MSPRDLKAGIWLVVLLALLTLPRGEGGAAEQGKAYDGHATTFSYFFQDKEMDFHFGNLVLGATANGGAEIGEAFFAASHMKDGDATSWQRQWYDLARLVEARGQASLAAGHKVSARVQFLRAANYYRLSVISLLPDDPAFRERGQLGRDLFKKAGALMDPPLEYIEIPFDCVAMPGYFRKASAGETPTRTLLVVGGSETFAEDLYYYIAPQALQRGYNFVSVDMPGQGLLPMQGQTLRTDARAVMSKVVDYLLSRPDVDPQRLASFAISGSVLFLSKAAEQDRRLKAIAMNLAVADAQALYASMPSTTAKPAERAAWSSFHANVVKGICWRFGVPMDQPEKLVEANAGNTFDPAKVAAPALIMVGEGENESPEVRRQQKVVLDGLPNPLKKMVVTPKAEGAANHCVLENRSLLGQVLFDWLDEVLK